MRIAFCWSHVSGYMAACWRELAALPGVELRIFSLKPSSAAPFDPEVMSGLDHVENASAWLEDASRVAEDVAAFRPDVVVIVGWAYKAYRRLRRHPGLANVKLVMGMDTPWRGTPKQRVGLIALRPFISSLDGVIVAGERSWQYARRLGVPETRILRGIYAVDVKLFGAVADTRDTASGWPKRLLYVGRYVPEKGLDVLLEAYRQYRASSAEPWPLTCCGSGPLQDRVAREPGVEDRGFVQPGDLPGVMRDHGVFVITSRYEPWGAVLAEAMAAGMPVICTEACAASIDLVRHRFNGWLVATGDARGVARSMRDASDVDLAAYGTHARQFAAAAGADVWAERVHGYAGRLLDHL